MLRIHGRIEAVPLRRIASFATLPAIAALTPMLVIPSLTASLGASGWAAIAVGQAVGTFAMTVTVFGWATTGPSELPRLSEQQRVVRYRTSLVSRILVAALVVPAAGLATGFLVSPEFRGPAALTTVAFGCWGLGPTWYFIGTNRPGRIAAFEMLPKLTAAIVTVIWLAMDDSAYAYPLTYLVAALGSSALAAFRICGLSAWRHVPGVRDHLRENFSITGARVVGSTFTTLSIPLVSAVNPAAVPAFAAVERARSFMWMAVNAVSAALQGWTAEDLSTTGSARRRRIAFGVTVSVGLGAGVLLALGLPIVDRWLFSDKIPISSVLALTSGATMVAVAASISLTYHFLGPSGRGRVIFMASVLGASVGVPAILISSYFWGSLGAATGVLLSELVVVAALACGARTRRPALARSINAT